VFERLRDSYSEPARAYHNGVHLSNCLAELSVWHGLARYPDEVEFALWFHDIVYDTHRDDNEDHSAAFAAEILDYAGCDEQVRYRIIGNILATSHTEGWNHTDEKLTADIDLTTLGESEWVYCEFERAIRLEYLWVPLPEYCKKRIEVLQGFLDRERIYHHAAIADLFEEPARRNLKRAIGWVSASSGI